MDVRDGETRPPRSSSDKAAIVYSPGTKPNAVIDTSKVSVPSGSTAAGWGDIDSDSLPLGLGVGVGVAVKIGVGIGPDPVAAPPDTSGSFS